MRMRKLSLIALALAVGGAAHADVLGNKATISAPITVSASNNTTGSWTPENLTVEGFRAGAKLGTLSVTATGSHDAIRVSGEGAVVNAGVVNVPFKDEQGQPVFRGRLLASAGAVDLADSGIDGLPGWKIENSNETFNVPVNALGSKSSLNPGTYTATFYVQQWQN
ncbi:TPA: CD15/CS22/SEF14 family fimbrial major subunit [Escherichia coli]|nr:CD15/CS22/SEF14 family fimbrial major subunit [Escherichia coli]